MSSPKRAVRLGPIGEIVRENVRHFRAMQKMTAQELSDSIGPDVNPLGRAAISEIERGARRVDVDDLVALAAGLDVRPIDLLLPALGQEVNVPGRGVVSATRYATWVRHGAPLKLDTEGLAQAKSELEQLRTALPRTEERIAEDAEMESALQTAIDTVSADPEGDADRLEMLRDMHASRVDTLRAQRDKLADLESRILGLSRAIGESDHGDD